MSTQARPTTDPAEVAMGTGVLPVQELRGAIKRGWIDAGERRFPQGLLQ